MTKFDFDREYLWNLWSYRQAEKGVIKHASFPVEQKKFGELRSTNDDGWRADVDPP